MSDQPQTGRYETSGSTAPDVSATEAAVVGHGDRRAVDDRIARALESTVGERVSSILFRSGRIDAVYGLQTDAGRQLLLKVHRQPVNL